MYKFINQKFKWNLITKNQMKIQSQKLEDHKGLWNQKIVMEDKTI